MARAASKTLIGGFVVGAIALAVLGVTIFGSGRLFRNRPTAVMFFSGTITGLSVGSPVKFRGVTVGQVTKIAAGFDPTDLSIASPVYVEFNPRSLIVSPRGKESLGEGADLFKTGRLYQPLLEKGLKAQLDVLSIVTGQLYINVDFRPEMPTTLVGLEPRYPEIPTIPSLRDQLTETLRKLPEKIMSATDAVDQLVHSPAVQEAAQGFAGATRELEGLIRELRAEVKPLTASLTASSDAAGRTFAQAEQALRQAGTSLEQLRSTLGSYERIAAQNANLGYDLSRTLSELDAAARAVRSLADSLERNPEAVLKGRR